VSSRAGDGRSKAMKLLDFLCKLSKAREEGVIMKNTLKSSSLLPRLCEPSYSSHAPRASNSHSPLPPALCNSQFLNLSLRLDLSSLVNQRMSQRETTPQRSPVQAKLNVIPQHYRRIPSPLLLSSYCQEPVK
jgi:hypothetical protein